MSVDGLIALHGKLVNVERRTTAQDPGGDPVGTWAGHLNGIRVFVQPASGADTLRYGRENQRGFVMCYAKPGHDIKANDRITGGDLGSRILLVQNVRKPGEFTTGPLAHIVLECEETDG